MRRMRVCVSVVYRVHQLGPDSMGSGEDLGEKDIENWKGGKRGKEKAFGILGLKGPVWGLGFGASGSTRA